MSWYDAALRDAPAVCGDCAFSDVNGMAYFGCPQMSKPGVCIPLLESCDERKPRSERRTHQV